MAVYHPYPAWRVVLRRIGAVVLGVIALPFLIFWPERARFYSYLHRIWLKTSDKPVWLAQAERAMAARCD